MMFVSLSKSGDALVLVVTRLVRLPCVARACRTPKKWFYMNSFS